MFWVFTMNFIQKPQDEGFPSFPLTWEETGLREARCGGPCDPLRTCCPSCLWALLSHNLQLLAAGLSCRETSSFKALPKAMPLPGWPTSSDLSMWKFKDPTLVIPMDHSSSKASSWGWQRHQACVPAGLLLCSLLLPPGPSSRVSPKGNRSLAFTNSLRVAFLSTPPVTQSRWWGSGTLCRTWTIRLQSSTILV